MGFYNELKTHVEANISAIYIETTEWERLENELNKVCQNTKKKIREAY